MLDLMGSGYIIDCCIAAYNKKRERDNFEVYVTDAMAALINMWTRDKYPRYYDLIHPPKVDRRSGREIADEVLKKHGLKVVG